LKSFDDFLEHQLERGLNHFTRDDLLRALSAGSSTLTVSLSKLVRKNIIANPRPGFYLILTPEDRAAGTPDPAQWIHALMKHQQSDYRISLITAAQIHGATTKQEAFQLIVPKELKDFTTGRHRIEYTHQPDTKFTRTNRPEWLIEHKKTKTAGIELTLLDCACWFHKAGGISTVGEITRDLGSKATPRKLATLAKAYDSPTARRLGFLLEQAGHEEQAKALEQFAEDARKTALLDPISKQEPTEMSGRWKIAVNAPKKG
jgi:predicted transcriptional regulator of viral defense system